MRKNRQPSFTTAPDKYIKGEISVDGFDLTSIIEWDGNKWNKIAKCNSGHDDEALRRDVLNAKLFACAPLLLKALKDLYNSVDRRIELTPDKLMQAKTVIEKATK